MSRPPSPNFVVVMGSMVVNYQSCESLMLGEHWPQFVQYSSHSPSPSLAHRKGFIYVFSQALSVSTPFQGCETWVSNIFSLTIRTGSAPLSDIPRPHSTYWFYLFYSHHTGSKSCPLLIRPIESATMTWPHFDNKKSWDLTTGQKWVGKALLNFLLHCRFKNLWDNQRPEWHMPINNSHCLYRTQSQSLFL